MEKWKRVSSLLLSLVMVLSLVPVGAWAEEPLPAEDESLAVEEMDLQGAGLVEEEIETTDEEEAAQEDLELSKVEEASQQEAQPGETEENPQPEAQVVDDGDKTQEEDADETKKATAERPGKTAETSEDAMNGTAGHSQSDAVSWARSQIGQSLDYDGYYGAQCVDLIMYYYRYLGASIVSGNGCDYSWNALPSGWSRITYYSGLVPQPGDIAVWGQIPSGQYYNPYGHVAIVVSASGSNFTCIDQNYAGKQYCREVVHQYNAASWDGPILCFIRPDFSSPISVSFSPWENASYTYIRETDAAFGQNISVSGGTCTETGMQLFDANGNHLATGVNHYYTPGEPVCFWINQELGYTLTPGTTYQYRFYAVVNGQAHWSNMYSFTTPPGTAPKPNAVLDVNGYLDSDGNAGYLIDYGTFDVYINGSRVANDVSDYCQSHPVGTSYEIKDIRPKDGKAFEGVYSGLRSGTLSGNVDVRLKFFTIDAAGWLKKNQPTISTYNGHTYYYFKTPVTWYEAEKISAHLGGHLVTLSNAAEQAFVSKLSNSGLWIGATDRDQEGVWKWVTGEPWSYTNWSTGEPNNHTSNDEGMENYAAIWNEALSRLWNDASGNNLFPFVCEIDKAYTVSYNANGGTDAPAQQTKAHGGSLTLSSAKPSKSYTVTWNANGGTVQTASVKLTAAFKNWNTAKNGSGSSYSPGGSYTADANATLYAQWTNPTAGTLPTPTRSDYIFDGWYTEATGGTKITSSTEVTQNVTYYAHWLLKNPVLTDVSNSVTGVLVKWKKVTGAEKYRVFRKADSGSWEKAGTTTGTSFTDKTAVSGTTYTYKVRCLSADGKAYTSGYSSGKKITFIAAPKISKVQNVNGGVIISWDKVTGAEKYRVFRKTAFGNWTKIGNTTGSSFTDKTADSGTTYAYTVRCLSKDGTTYTSAYDTTGKTIQYIAAPVISKLEKVSSGGVKVTWGKVTGAEKYRVFRKTGTGSWTKLADTTAVSYTDKTAAKGKTYSYTVRCLSKDGKTYTSAYNTTGKSITR